MSAPIGPGDWVECVDAAPNPRFPHAPMPLQKGAIYQIEVVDVNVWGEQGVILRGIRSSVGYRGGFNADRFRPVYRPRADLIESLKAPPVVAPSDLEHA